MNQHRNGNTGVYYDDSGRIIHPGGRRRPDDTLPEPHRESRRHKMREHGRPDYVRGGPRPHGDYPRGARQYDNGGYRPEPRRYEQQLGYPRAGLAYGPRPEDDYTEYSDSRYTGDNDQIGPRLMGALFVGFGTLLLALAIIEVMLCIEHGYYCLFWTGALVFEFGMFTFIHKGDYHVPWKNVVVLALGFLATVAVHISVAWVMKPLAAEFIMTGMADTNDQYEALWHLLGFNLGETSHVDISSTAQPWVCLGINAGSMFVLVLSFLVLTATALMADRIWREFRYYDDENFGLCNPRLFNPYGQLSAAQALSFVGMISIYATYGTDWHDYWTPVWTAGLVAIAGIMTVAALKREELLHLSGIALVLQVLSVGGCVATVVLATMGLVDCVKLLDDTQYAGGFHRRWIIASACIFALVDIVALVNSFYGVGLTVRLFDNLYRSSSPVDENEKRNYSENASGYDDRLVQSRNQYAAQQQRSQKWGYGNGTRYDNQAPRRDPRWYDKMGGRY